MAKRMKRQIIKNSFRYKLCLHKAYFEQGLGLTNYVKYLIAFFGLASRDVLTTLIIGIGYAFFSYILGWFWYNTKFREAEQEVNNQFNLFVQEMRSYSAKRKI